MCKALEYTTKLFDSLEMIRSEWNSLNRKLSIADQKILDIEHYIEITSNLNASQGYCMYSMLKETLIERRNVKNKLDELKPIWNDVRNIKGLDSRTMGARLQSIKDRNRNNENAEELRHYNVRILTDVFGDKIKAQ